MADVSKPDYEAIHQRLEANELSESDLDAIADVSVDFLRSLLRCFGENTCSIDEYEGEDGDLILNVADGDLAVLIGRHGRVLESLQLLVTSVATRTLGFYYPVSVDIESYRERRKARIISLAHRAASKVHRNGGSVKLPVMNAYERRIAHIALREDTGVTTYSEGEDPNRYVVVAEVYDAAPFDEE